MAIITGDAGNNTLTGTGMDDVIDGGLGADAMSGLGGNDTYMVDNWGDTVIEAAGGGIDTVKSSVDYSLPDNVENLVLTGTTFNGEGNALDNVITGNAGDNSLYGAAGNDTLIGGAGNDYLTGAAGNDVMNGGLGDDRYFVDNIHDQVVETVSNAAGGGNDTVYSDVSFSLATLANVDNVVLNVGTGSTNATGNALSNFLGGNEGNNVLDGGAGADVMRGNAGNDTYMVDNVGDVVDEFGGGGNDTIISTIALTTAVLGVENYTFNTSAAVHFTAGGANGTITGGSGDDALTGGTGWDTLHGGAGSDQLFGGDHDDTLDGGTGADRMTGGWGNDGYVVDNAGDQVVELPDDGHDAVSAWISIAHLWDNVEDAYLATGTTFNGNITGNALDNTLWGNDGSNLLDGGAGADTLKGLGGNDTYMVDSAVDHVLEDAGGGTDLVVSSVTWTLGANVENLTLTGSADLIGVGNSLANVIVGNDGNNVLLGGAGSDSLDGGLGNDAFDAGDGNDHLTGGAGNDTLFCGTGNDTVTGDAGDDLITGYQGNDVMTGGAGSDTFAFVLGAGDGSDTITDFAKATDQLWFHGVGDNNHDSAVTLADLFADIAGAGVVDHGLHHDVAVAFTDGSQITFAGAGTGAVHSIADLVASPAQIHVD